MRKTTGWVIALAVALVGAGGVAADDHDDLPAGPIHDRHELMEAIGDHAEAIGDAMKAGDSAIVAREAEAIGLKAKQVNALFPKGSTHEKSRAKPEIWEKWAEFERLTKAMGDDAAALAMAARGGNKDDMSAASQKMFKDCKSCHDQFRIPEKDEGD